MRLTTGQIYELERVAKNYGVRRTLLVRAISQVGIDVVLRCIDATDYDWVYNNGMDQSDFSYEDRLALLLLDNGAIYGL